MAFTGNEAIFALIRCDTPASIVCLSILRRSYTMARGKISFLAIVGVSLLSSEVCHAAQNYAALDNLRGAIYVLYKSDLKMTGELVSDTFGWPISRAETTQRNFKIVAFALYSDRAGSNPSLTTQRLTGDSRLDIQIYTPSLCLFGKDIVNLLGNGYRRLPPSLVDGESSKGLPAPSQEVAKNFRMFSSGPEYIIEHTDFSRSIAFLFNYSPCVETIVVTDKIKEK